MNIICKELNTPVLNIEEGDEIGVFDGDNCVAAAKVVPPITNETPLCLAASADNPYTSEIDGFESNNPISIKLWDKDKQIYVYETEVEFWEKPGISADTTFAAQNLVFTDVTLDSIPANSAIYSGSVSVLGDPGSIGDTIKVFDNNRNLCGIDILTQEGQYDSLAVTNATPNEKVYFDYYDSSEDRIYYNAAVDSSWNPNTFETIDIEIEAVNDTVNMFAGWNLISFDIINVDNSPDSVFAPIMSKVITIKGFDPNGIDNGQGANGALVYDPTLQPQFNTLNYILPGFG